MAVLVSEFFSITGIDAIPPSNIAELIPYLLTVVVGVALVSAVFGVIGSMVRLLLNWRHWR